MLPALPSVTGAPFPKSSIPRRPCDLVDEEIVPVSMPSDRRILSSEPPPNASAYLHTCQTCGKSFKKLGNLKIHMVRQHESTVVLPSSAELNVKTSAFKSVFDNRSPGLSTMKASSSSLSMTKPLLNSSSDSLDFLSLANRGLLKPIEPFITTNTLPDIIELPSSPLEDFSVFMREVKIRSKLARKRPAPPALKMTAVRRCSVEECDDVVAIGESNRRDDPYVTKWSVSKTDRPAMTSANQSVHRLSPVPTCEPITFGKENSPFSDQSQTRICQLCKKSMQSFSDLQEHVVSFHRVPFTIYIDNLSLQIQGGNKAAEKNARPESSTGSDSWNSQPKAENASQPSCSDGPNNLQ